ncbi:hypothetical protein [Nostoc sp. CHAB 5715]|uniref:hypothetical protein n=1 Tax=Nostoc sp. CHAB 5715 TaxID=2780400 RepID=UPI001E56318B|nr:hypothetical protein [Nostoc sp. CHAB 5715]MCC5624786.1 hypothetical protein [Nostoc sp. CHAB 5715]
MSESAKNTILYNALQAVCDRVREMSGQRFIITLKRSGKTEQLLNDVDKGVVQCGYNGIYYGTQKLKILYFGCAIPFGLNPQEQNAWLYYKKDPNPEAPTFMKEKIPETGIQLMQFNEEILKAAREETIKLLDQYAIEDEEDFKYVYDEWKNFTQQI